jgi:glycosyltransferase involved in cell wall biosynthesis
MGRDTLSVVTIVRDDPGSVARLLASIARLDAASHGAGDAGYEADVEVVVVDDGSSPPLEIPAMPFAVVPVRVEGDGNRSAARNAGAAAAGGRLLAFVDSDQELPAHWLRAHLAWHRERPGRLVAGYRRHREDGGGWRPEVRTRVTSRYSENSARIASSWYLAFSCNITVAADAFTAVGGFDEGYSGWGFEDSDLGYRLHRSGVRTELAPRAWSLDHHHAVRVDAERVRGWQANRRRFVDRHADPVAQATLLIDNYPDGKARPPGEDWLRSFVRFDDRVRAAEGLPELDQPREVMTVLSPADAEDARRRVSAGEAVSIVDGLPDSGLDRHVHDFPSAAYRTVTDR